MATERQRNNIEIEKTLAKYASCIITPMSSDENGKPFIKTVHIVDAAIVGGIVFFSLLLGTSLPALLVGEKSYITAAEVQQRLLTAAIGFGLTFFAQWARYRGVKLIKGMSKMNKEK